MEMSQLRPILVTGFEPYGGLSSNPSHQAMERLDGASIAGLSVIGRGLPVALARIGPAIAAVLDDIDPAAVVSLGLSPGEAVIRIERLAVNLADFVLPDNDGHTHCDRPVIEDGPASLFSTLPVRAIEAACNGAGIPARLSLSAGSYLCNACLYRFLSLAAVRPRSPLCGFLHVPHTPEEVARRLADEVRGRRAPADSAELSSMELARIVRAAEIAITETARVLDRCEAIA
jgi:pyroglutamyl-peptidase